MNTLKTQKVIIEVVINKCKLLYYAIALYNIIQYYVLTSIATCA